MDVVERADKPQGALKRGWTTGACAAAATKAALSALFSGKFPDPVTITLPGGESPAFALVRQQLDEAAASAAIVKDAGDDPDVTHGATIMVTVRHGRAGAGVIFRAGQGVGTITRPGLPLAVGEPAINPMPRKMMSKIVVDLCHAHQLAPDIEITVSVPNGEKIAERTWNLRLGIIGGISILGTTGIVHPFSCSAWIHSIHRGIDVCRASGIEHALGATGTTSENAARVLYDFPNPALLDMGDFAGGLLKYVRKHPIPRLTLAGGFAKFTKLANGAMDLHSGRSLVDMDWLAEQAGGLGANPKTVNAITSANTALEALQIATKVGIDLPARIAELAAVSASQVLRDAPVELEIIVVGRDGTILARTGKFDG